MIKWKQMKNALEIYSLLIIYGVHSIFFFFFCKFEPSKKKMINENPLYLRVGGETFHFHSLKQKKRPETRLRTRRNKKLLLLLVFIFFDPDFHFSDHSLSLLLSVLCILKNCFIYYLNWNKNWKKLYWAAIIIVDLWMQHTTVQSVWVFFYTDYCGFSNLLVRNRKFYFLYDKRTIFYAILWLEAKYIRTLHSLGSHAFWLFILLSQLCTLESFV